LSAGIAQSSNTTSVGTDAVRIVRIGVAVKPGVPRSTMKHEMPARPRRGSVRANTTPQGASCAREMKTLRPLRTQRSPRRSARVWMAPAGSEPPDGSVIAQNVSWPSRTAGTAYRAICSGVPPQITGGGLRPKTPAPGL
jgi:hypothetical protein